MLREMEINKISVRKIILAIASTVAMTWLPVTAEAATTGLNFTGGCPSAGSDDNGSLCGVSGQATDANVAAILGVDVSLVTEVFHVDSSPNSYITGIDFSSGTWDLGLNLDNITHLSFKADGYFVLAEVTANSGEWMMWAVGAGPVSGSDAWGTDVSLACPATICNDGSYDNSDFLNGGSMVANLSNVTGYSVVPVPAAVWLFGSGLLGLVAVSRRKV
jgi:hypothetical protein